MNTIIPQAVGCATKDQETLPLISAAEAWASLPRSVSTWLKQHALDQLADSFAEHRIETVMDIIEMNDVELAKLCGSHVGPLVRLRRAVVDLRHELLGINDRLRNFEDSNASVDTVWSTSLPLTSAFQYRRYQIIFGAFGILVMIGIACAECWVLKKSRRADIGYEDVPPLYWVHDILLVMCAFMFILASLLAANSIGSRYAPKWCIVFACFAFTLLEAVVGLGLDLVFEWLNAPAGFICGVVVAFDEKYCGKMLMFLIVFISVKFLVEGILFSVEAVDVPDHEEKDELVARRLSGSVALILSFAGLTAWVQIKAYKKRQAALKAVGSSVDTYDEQWLKIKQTQRADIDQVKELCNIILDETELDTSASYGPGLNVKTSNQKLLQPARSLQALFIEAWMLIDIFETTMRKLAEQCNGHLKCGAVKSQTRVMEKVLRSYRGSHRSCNDLIRATIIFQDVIDMVACLEILKTRLFIDLSPTGINVCRIKNRYHPDYDARAKSAGYRDVCMNIRITTREATVRKVTGHFAELQLQMQGMYDAKEGLAAGHGAYQKFRNALND